MQVELTDAERKFLLNKLWLDLFTYESHLLMGNLQPPEVERLEQLRALYARLDGKGNSENV